MSTLFTFGGLSGESALNSLGWVVDNTNTSNTYGGSYIESQTNSFSTTFNGDVTFTSTGLTSFAPSKVVLHLASELSFWDPSGHFVLHKSIFIPHVCWLQVIETNDSDSSSVLTGAGVEFNAITYNGSGTPYAFQDVSPGVVNTNWLQLNFVDSPGHVLVQYGVDGSTWTTACTVDMPLILPTGSSVELEAQMNGFGTAYHYTNRLYSFGLMDPGPTGPTYDTPNLNGTLNGSRTVFF